MQNRKWKLLGISIALLGILGAMLSLGISSYFHLEAALLVLAGVTSNALLASKEKRLRGEWARVQFILGGSVC